MQYISGSALETRQFAEEFAKKLLDEKNQEHSVILAMSGDLGAGKTTFAQGFAKGLGINDKIISPTFILVREHPIPHSNSVFYHLDLYRLDEDFDFREIGLEDYFSSNGIVLIEWAEKLKNNLPRRTIHVNLEKTSDTQRQITIDNF